MPPSLAMLQDFLIIGKITSSLLIVSSILSLTFFAISLAVKCLSSVLYRCLDANLMNMPVEIETPDRHYYHVCTSSLLFQPLVNELFG